LRILTDFKSDYFAVCNVNGTWNDIPTPTCIAWYGQLAMAYKDKTPIEIYYPDDNDCNNFPSYTNAPRPDYIINGES